MAVMGIAQNLKEEENVLVARGAGAKSVQASLGQATNHGLHARSSKTTVRDLGSNLTRGKHESPQPGMRRA